MSISSSYYKLCKHHLLELPIFCSGETIIYLIYCTLFIPLFCYYEYKCLWHKALSPFQNLHQVELLGTSKVTHSLRSLMPIAQLLSKKACRSTPSTVMQGTLHFITPPLLLLCLTVMGRSTGQTVLFSRDSPSVGSLTPGLILTDK